MVENEIWEADVRWKSCSMELACLHAGRFCEHPLSVFEAVCEVRSAQSEVINSTGRFSLALFISLQMTL